MTGSSNLEIAKLLMNKVQTHSKLKHLTENKDPETLNADPWLSNFAAVSSEEDPDFCEEISSILGEHKKPLFVAIMRSVDDPTKLISPFHSVHMDSRKSDKTLMILAGDSDYPVFAKINWKEINIYQKIYIRSLQILLFLIEKFRLFFLQGKLSHNLPYKIKDKVYCGTVYQNRVTGELIKFDNMLPHHSHPLPTQYSVLLQVVYD